MTIQYQHQLHKGQLSDITKHLGYSAVKNGEVYNVSAREMGLYLLYQISGKGAEP